jgi:hypothetical protein
MNDGFRNRLRKYDRISGYSIGTGKLQNNEYLLVIEIDDDQVIRLIFANYVRVLAGSPYALAV